jgi:hypothetical protein
MSTPRRFSYDYPRDAESLAALLQNPEFLRWRAETAGDTNVEVTIQQKADGILVRVARDREVQLPAFAKKMFGSVNRVVDETLWNREGGQWVARYEIEIPGIPGEVKGKSAIVPRASGCSFESAFEVTSRLPMLGSKVESFVADRIEETLRANAERNAQYLAS